MFTLIAAPGRGDSDRLGLAVSRRVGGAVQRNRARRLLRDAFRRLSKTVAPTYDVVLVARPEISGRTQAEVDGELSKRFQRLVAQHGRASPPAAD
jgi:ribonuclease P protein component